MFYFCGILSGDEVYDIPIDIICNLRSRLIIGNNSLLPVREVRQSKTLNKTQLCRV